MKSPDQTQPQPKPVIDHRVTVDRIMNKTRQIEHPADSPTSPQGTGLGASESLKLSVNESDPQKDAFDLSTFFLEAEEEYHLVPQEFLKQDATGNNAWWGIYDKLIHQRGKITTEDIELLRTVCNEYNNKVKEEK